MECCCSGDSPNGGTWTCMNSIGNESIEWLSIGEQLHTIEARERKRYTRFLHADGFELGFGMAGNYPAHAHIHFLDLLYAPTGLEAETVNNQGVAGTLLVVPPRTHFGPVTTGDFFFMK